MYDVCIRKNRHGDWVAVIKWTVFEFGTQKGQKTHETSPTVTIHETTEKVADFIYALEY